MRKNKLELWQAKTEAAQKHLRIAQSLQGEALALLKDSQNLPPDERAKILPNVVASLAKSQSMEDESYDRISDLECNYPYG